MRQDCFGLEFRGVTPQGKSTQFIGLIIDKKIAMEALSIAILAQGDNQRIEVALVAVPDCVSVVAESSTEYIAGYIKGTISTLTAAI